VKWEREIKTKKNESWKRDQLSLRMEASGGGGEKREGSRDLGGTRRVSEYAEPSEPN